ncbi:MAG: glycine dehydrogenase, partial [Bacilli bacterium]|nr:glycine dehydrogenase [Bacilli bacterium]
MFKYFPHTLNDEKEMLAKINLSELDQLFSDVPDQVKVKEVNIPSSLSEIELRNKANKLASINKQLVCFAGAGSYDCYTPSVVNAITSRQEFLTSYTPYQAEISQGTLQYIFEYQTMICNLTGMDVANASNYDGATAAMEAMLMAVNQTRKNTFILPLDINPRVAEVVKTLAKMHGIKIIECSV